MRGSPAKPDPQTPDFRPLYAQIKDLIIQRLAAGHWRPGDPLPAEPRLAEEFGVSQGTVRKALDQLADQNLVVRRQGKGTFVTAHTPDRALFHFFHLVGDDGAKRLPETRSTTTRAGKANRRERAALSLEPEALVVRLARIRTLDGQPVMAERIVVPERLFPGLAARSPHELPNTLYELYEQAYGIPIAAAEERLRAVAADEADARGLEIAPGTPLLEIDRIARSHGDRTVEWRVTRVDTSRHHYHNDLD